MCLHWSSMLVLFSVAVLGAQVGAEQKAPLPYTRTPDFANLAYGPHSRHMLDLWKAKSDRPTPLVVYFNPGGFSAGDKTWLESWDQGSLRDMCLARGISVATANYRYAAQAPLPAACSIPRAPFSSSACTPGSTTSIRRA